MATLKTTNSNSPLIALLLIILKPPPTRSGPVSLGPLETWHFNGLQAKEVTLLNRKQIRIEEMYFTDEGPAVWFMVGRGEDEYKEEFANLEGVIVPDEEGSCTRLKGYNFADVTITLPSGMQFTEYDYLSVFCVRFNHNFGYVTIPRGLVFDNETLLEEAKVVVPDSCPQDVEGRVPADDDEDHSGEDDDGGKSKKKGEQDDFDEY